MHILQNVLRLLSMLSFQQQNNMINNHHQQVPSFNTMMPSMTNQSSQQQQQPSSESQYDHSSINGQQYLADKIQAVRHLWESENQYSNPTFQQGTHGFVQFQ